MRNKRILALLAVLVAIAAISFLVYTLANRPQRGIVSGGEADSATAPSSEAGTLAGIGEPGTLVSGQMASVRRSARPAFPRMNPYSVVREGICASSNAPDQEKASRQKWEALLRDPFWQSIFPGVNPDEFSLVKTSLPMDRYVAYWKMENGELIHWTGKKIIIPAGTRAFIDARGQMYLCACGNQVAEVLPANLSATVLAPEQEPPAAYLVPLEPESLSVTRGDAPAENPVAISELATPPPHDGSEPVFPVPPIFLPSDGQPGPGPPPGPPPPRPPEPPPQPPEVPEPGTLSLILIGFGATIIARAHRKQQ